MRGFRHAEEISEVLRSMDVQPRAVRGGGVPQGPARRAGDRGGRDSLPERRAGEGAGGGEPRRPHGRVRAGGKPRVRHRDAGLPRGPDRAPDALLPGGDRRDGAGPRGRLRAAPGELRRVLLRDRPLQGGRGRLLDRAGLLGGPGAGRGGRLALARVQCVGRRGCRRPRPARFATLRGDGAARRRAVPRDRLPRGGVQP